MVKLLEQRLAQNKRHVSVSVIIPGDSLHCAMPNLPSSVRIGASLVYYYISNYFFKYFY